MSIKLNGATSGSVELDVPDAIGSDLNITIPGAAGTLDRLERAGNIVQVVTANYDNFTSSIILVTKDTTSAAAQYGSTITNRTYGDITSVTITPQYSNSTLLIGAQVGYSSTTRSDRGAQGIVIVKDNTSIYEFSSYPNYDSLNLQTSYPEDSTLVFSCPAVNTNAQTFYLKGFAYNEEAGSTSHIVRFLASSLYVMEIKA